MIKKFLSLFFSLKFSIIILLIFSMAQIYATLGFPSDEEAWIYVYGSRWFELIMWLLGLNLVGVLYRYKTYKKPPIFLVHIAIIVILIGAATTRYFGLGGVLHLRINETKSNFMVTNRANPDFKKSKSLGFSIRLDNFVVKKYPGSMQPSSYDSYVTVIDGNKSFPYHIYMNHILTYKGYRIYQMSYDRDELGSILFINHDPGMLVTYFGYLLLTLGFLWLFLYKKSRLLQISRNLNIGKNTISLILTALFLLISLNSTATTIDIWSNKSKNVSCQWSKIPVQFHGRIEPMDTLDMDIMHKISKKTKLYEMDYNQIVLGMISYPYLFQSLKMIYIGNKNIRKKLHIPGKYASYNDFFMPNGKFSFYKEVDDAMHKSPSERNEIDREWLKINERVYIAFSVYTASIFKIFPPINSSRNNSWYSVRQLKYLDSPDVAQHYFNLFRDFIYASKHYNIKKAKNLKTEIYNIQKKYANSIMPSAKRLKAEIFYNHIKIFPSLIGIYTLLGIIFILMGFVEVFKGKPLKKVSVATILIGWIVFLIHSANMLLRWYISGHMPWSDAYESIIFIAWSAAFVSLVFFKRKMLVLGAGFFVAGMFMMVAHLNSIDPQITNMVPVLKSYWLLIHVAVITIGYGFLAVSAMLGLINILILLLKRKFELKEISEYINNIIYIAMYAGLIFLTIGTFLGGVWANESWGRYWSWDPKETWSLITIIAYSIVLHIRVINAKMEGLMFPVLSFFSFFFILMTYFGVNFYIAQGLHSYGRGEGAYAWFYVLKAGIAVWFVLVSFIEFSYIFRYKISK